MFERQYDPLGLFLSCDIMVFDYIIAENITYKE